MTDSASATSFDVRIRTIECPRCGAPVTAAILGGCAGCGGDVRRVDGAATGPEGVWTA